MSEKNAVGGGVPLHFNGWLIYFESKEARQFSSHLHRAEHSKTHVTYLPTHEGLE